MKTILILVAVIFLPATLYCAATTEDEHLAEARRIADCLSTDNFAEAGKFYNELMKSSLSPKQLEAVWRDLTKRYGKFERLGQARTRQLAGYDLVEQTIVFQNDSLTQRTVFDADGLVAGLFILPGQDEAGTDPASSEGKAAQSDSINTR